MGQARQALEPGDFRQTLEKIALYKFGDSQPLTAAEVDAMAPATIDAEMDEVVRAAAEGRARDIGLLMRRLEGQGLLTSEWREEEKRKKRFYVLSPGGEAMLAALTEAAGCGPEDVIHSGSGLLCYIPLGQE